MRACCFKAQSIPTCVALSTAMCSKAFVILKIFGFAFKSGSSTSTRKPFEILIIRRYLLYWHKFSFLGNSVLFWTKQPLSKRKRTRLEKLIRFRNIWKIT
ncbi:MAG: hypothetical protein FJ349_07340 [Sphingomonadales bacterium]|nr:hypothetical protein [Sphingomonadales bacterium]